MVLKQLQVTTLYDLSLQVVSDNIFKFVKEHCGSCEFCSICKTEQCSKIKPVMEILSLPENIIQSIYEDVFPQIVLSVTIKSDPNVNFPFVVNSYTNLLYLLLSLLKVEQTSVKIKNFWFKRHDKDIPFILKFGKNINSLQFEEKCFFGSVETYELQDNPEHSMLYGNQSNSGSSTYDISASLCSVILQSATNIQVLDFHSDVKVNDELFEIIGRECTQLKVLNNIRVGEEYATAQSFVKLLFRSPSNETGTHRNKCCDTLQAVNFDHREFVTEHDTKMNEIIALLVQNIPNLKSFGKYVNLEYYLETHKDGEIHETALDYICFCELKNQTAAMLNTFCPTVKKLNVMTLESGVVESLSSLKCLEEISVETEPIVAPEIFTAQWCNLKVLTVSFPMEECFIYLDVDLIAKNLPVLTNLSIAISRASWSGNTYFNCLENVSFEVLDSNIAWFASFANTAKSLDIFCCNDAMSPDSCKVLLTLPFPNLKYLRINHFPYNFKFYSHVLAKLPKLETCIIYDYEETKMEREQYLEQLSKFLETNNFQCELGGASPFFYNSSEIEL